MLKLLCEALKVIKLQEIKCSDDKLPGEVKEISGYKGYWCSSKKDGIAGVGIFTKKEPLSIKYGIDDEEQDTEGRCITLEFEKFYVVNVYVPNSGEFQYYSFVLCWFKYCQVVIFMFL